MVTHKEEAIIQLLPRDFQYLTQQSKIQFKTKAGVINLKTEYLIDIICQFLKKYYCTCKLEYKFNISSLILKRRYGEYYNFYMDWLISKDFIWMVSNYCNGVKTKTYQINPDFLDDPIKFKSYDKFLLKKNSQYLYDSIIGTKSPIELPVRKKLVNNLQYIEIDSEGALSFLNKYYDKHNKEEIAKYQKNKIAIENIRDKDPFFSFDEYGRFHTNFTILKREIRKNFLTIKNEMLGEVDIKNSQPYFFAIYMKESNPTINGDTRTFFDLVKNGLLYEDIMQRSSIKNREDVKRMVVKVLFDDSNHGHHPKENEIFKELYPSVHKHLSDFKKTRNYKECSYMLQKMESDFLMNTVVKEIMEKYPEIIFFTIHDSIMYPLSQDAKVKEIFNKHKKILDDLI